MSLFEIYVAVKLSLENVHINFCHHSTEIEYYNIWTLPPVEDNQRPRSFNDFDINARAGTYS